MIKKRDMKIQDLRVSNYLTVNPNSPWKELVGQTVEVTGLQCRNDKHFPDSNFIIEFEYQSQVLAFSNFSQFDEFMSPIPLTEEWLVKFGFNQKTYFDTDGCEYYEFKNGSFKIYNSEYSEEFHVDFNVSDGCSVHVKTVHQLQNLYFALTGEELTLKQ